VGILGILLFCTRSISTSLFVPGRQTLKQRKIHRDEESLTTWQWKREIPATKQLVRQYTGILGSLAGST